MRHDPEHSVAGAVALLGVPSDENSSLLSGAAAAPAAIRSALFDPGSNMATEDGGNLARDPRFVDAGDLDLPAGDAATRFEAIVNGTDALLARGPKVLALGGDHAVTYPLVRAHAGHREGFAIVQIDAHPDLYDDFEGNRYSHASGFARIMEEGLATRLVQVGIRASTPHQREQAARFGVETVDLRDPEAVLERLPDWPVYLSLDLDGLDPAFAPGVSHPEPGGLSTREVLHIVQRLPGPLIGADVVELNPRRDVNGTTALVAAKLVKEIAARMLSDERS
jgi:agmatinase